MYYFEAGRYRIPLFWKENGLPIFMGHKRLSKRKIVWWMPLNWVAIAALVSLIPVSLALDWWGGRNLFENRHD